MDSVEDILNDADEVGFKAVKQNFAFDLVDTALAQHNGEVNNLQNQIDND